jgi:hypothetical protein
MGDKTEDSPMKNVRPSESIHDEATKSRIVDGTTLNVNLFGSRFSICFCS